VIAVVNEIGIVVVVSLARFGLVFLRCCCCWCFACGRGFGCATAYFAYFVCSGFVLLVLYSPAQTRYSVCPFSSIALKISVKHVQSPSA
jgi:hypothetical protein